MVMTGEVRVGDVGGGATVSSSHYTQAFVQGGKSGDIAYGSDSLSSTRIATFKIATHNGTLLFKNGDNVKLNLDGLLIYYGSAPVVGNRYAYLVTATDFWCKLHFSDGTYKNIQLNVDDLKLNCPSGSYPYLYFDHTFTATADISALEYYIFFDKNCFSLAYSSSNCKYVGSYLTDCDMTYTISSSDTVQIRDGILGIIDRLKLTYDKVVSGFSNVTSGIGNLPSNLWNKMNGSFTSLIGSTGDILTSVGSVVSYLNKLPSDMWNKMSSSFGDLIAGNESLLSSTGDILAYTSSLPTNIWNKMSGSFGNLISSAGNIYNTLQDMPGLVWGEMKETFTSIKTNTQSLVTDVKNAPSLIAGNIKDGVSSLFLPDEEFFSDYQKKYTDLFKTHLGAVYESIDIVTDLTGCFFVQTFATRNSDILYMPELRIDIVGSEFVFGGYEVDMLPEGLEDYVESAKFAVDVVCTLASINALKNRFYYDVL